MLNEYIFANASVVCQNLANLYHLELSLYLQVSGKNLGAIRKIITIKPSTNVRKFKEPLSGLTPQCIDLFLFSK